MRNGNRNPDDPLAPARGIINAIWMAIIVWIVVGVVVWAVFFR